MFKKDATVGSKTWRRRAAMAAAAGLLASPFALGASTASAVSIEDAGYDPDAGVSSLGYWMVASDGGVFAHGKAGFFGSLGDRPLNSPIVGIETNVHFRSSGGEINNGYYLVAADGGVFSFGDQESYPFHGSMGGQKLNSPIVGMALSPHGGYYLVAADGGVFAFGGAPYLGSLGGEKLTTKIVGMVASDQSEDPGYYIAGADGSVWKFGEVGPIPASSRVTTLNAPIVGIDTGVNEENDEGVYLTAADGGVFAFGATSHGSAGGQKLNAPVVGAHSGLVSDGYTLVASDGGVFNYGEAGFHGSQGGAKLNRPVVGISAF